MSTAVLTRNAGTEGDVAEAVESTTSTDLDRPWRVLLFDDDVHTFEEVIVQLMKATGCSSAHAERLAWTVHTTGKAMCFEGAFEACFRVKSVLDEIALITQIEG